MIYENETAPLALGVSNLASMLKKSAGSYPSHVMIDFFGKTWRYSEGWQEVQNIAKALAQQGVTKGDRIGLCLPNTPYSVFCFYAVQLCGAIVVNLNPLSAPETLAHQIRDAGIKVIIHIDVQPVAGIIYTLAESDPNIELLISCSLQQALPTIKGILFKVFKGSNIVGVPESAGAANCISLDDLLDQTTWAGFDPPQIDRKDIAVIQYTGGTTGTPKGAMLSHGNLLGNIEQFLAIKPGLSTGCERFLCVLPFFHIFALTALLNLSIAVAGTMYLLPRFEVKMTLAALKRVRPTVFPAVPTVYNGLLRSGKLVREHMAQLKYCISGGAPLPVALRTEFVEKTGVRLVEGYGLTESSPVLSLNALVGDYVDGSIGKPIPATTMCIRDPENPDKILPFGERGEIYSRGQQVMAGYFNKPKDTKDTIRGGWLRTGDLGYMDKEGNIFVVDRKKDLILVGGFNVYPRHIEDWAYKHHGVMEAIAIGIPDDYLGEVPKLFVKKRPNYESLTVEELGAFLKDHLSKVERPRQIEFRDELPKTMIGKLSKKELVEEERALAAARGQVK